MPNMDPSQMNQMHSIQELLGGGAENSIRGLLSGGQSPIDSKMISGFERDIMPRITQGAAHSNLMGASGVAGAQADATRSLAEGMAAQRYSAIGDLLDKYGQFAQKDPYRRSVWEEPSNDMGGILSSILSSVGSEDDGGTDWARLAGNVTGGIGGAFYGGVGSSAGSQIMGELFSRLWKMYKKSGGSNG